MTIKERIRGFFVPVQPVIQKATEELGRIVAPQFRDIPPDPKASKFLKEGVKSWAYIAICAIADEIASAKIKIMKKQGEEWIEQEDHPALDLVRHPNGFQTKEEMQWLQTVFLLAEGEAPLLVNRDKDPDEMVLIDPARLKIKWGDKNIIDHYVYTKSDGKEQDIEAGNIVFLKFPSITTPFRGAGQMNFIRQTLDLDNYMEEYLRIFFFNDATPSAVLQTDQVLNKSIIKRLHEQFRQRHGGINNKHKMAILEGGLEWKEISSKFGDLQMNAIQESIRDKVMSAFKVPKSIVGITKDVSRANGENEDRIFARRALVPRMKMIEAQLTQFLLPKFGDNADMKFEFENPVSDDLERQAKIDDIYIKAGVLEPNEIRERMGLEPLKEPKEPAEGGNEPPEEESEEEEKKPKAKKPKKGVITESFENIMIDYLGKNNKKEFTEKEIEDFHNQKIQVTDDIEDRFNLKLIKYFERQKKEIIQQLKGKAVIDIDNKKEVELLIKLAAPFLMETIQKQSSLAFALLAQTDKIPSTDEKANEFIKDRTVKLGKSATKTTQKKVDKILKEWALEEGSIADLKNKLKVALDSTKRATVITRTEVSRSAGWATTESYRRSGIVGKQWATAKDERTCQYCRPMDGVVIPIKRNYWNKGDTMKGDEGGTLNIDFEGVAQFPLHAQCRCDLLPVFGEEEIPEHPFDYKKESDEYKRISQLDKRELSLIDKESVLRKKETQVKKTLTEIEKMNGIR